MSQRAMNCSISSLQTRGMSPERNRMCLSKYFSMRKPVMSGLFRYSGSDCRNPSQPFSARLLFWGTMCTSRSPMISAKASFGPTTMMFSMGAEAFRVSTICLIMGLPPTSSRALFFLNTLRAALPSPATKTASIPISRYELEMTTVVKTFNGFFPDQSPLQPIPDCHTYTVGPP